MKKFFAFLVAIVILLPVGALLWNRPPLTEPPGIFQRFKTYLFSNVAETSPDSPFPELRTRTYPVPTKQLYDALLKASMDLGWESVTSGFKYESVSAVIRTPVLGFRDDITLRLVPVSETETTLSMRSASRVGKGDFAANTRHILNVYRAVEEVLGEPGRVAPAEASAAQ